MPRSPTSRSTPAVIEVGLGGTWDSTNVADAKIAVITPIGIDHTDYLGDTLTEIAGNKAGIIKPDSIAVVGPQEQEAMNAILRRTIEVDAFVARFGSEFSVLDRAFAVGGQRLTLQGLGGVYEDIFLPLAGEHQATNAAVALAAVEAFFGAGRQPAARHRLRAGRFRRGGVTRAAGAGAHVADDHGRRRAQPARRSALSPRRCPLEFSFTRLVGVLAVMADKDARGILEALADSFDEVVVTRNSSPRSMPVAGTGRAGHRHLRRGEGACGGPDGRGHRDGRRSGRGRHLRRRRHRRDHHRFGGVRR